MQNVKSEHHCRVTILVTIQAIHELGNGERSRQILVYYTLLIRLSIWIKDTLESAIQSVGVIGISSLESNEGNPTHKSQQSTVEHHKLFTWSVTILNMHLLSIDIFNHTHRELIKKYGLTDWKILEIRANIEIILDADKDPIPYLNGLDKTYKARFTH